MTNLLVITSSAQAERSVSTGLVEHYVDALRQSEPELRVVRRDVGKDPIPHLTAQTVGAIRGTAQTPAEQQAKALSDALVAEVQQADVIVIGSPMYNFGISSTLKTWFDHVLRAGLTFRYTPEGVAEGLLRGKKAIVVESRAGLYSKGPGSAMDSQEPLIRTLLAFIGVTDVTFVRAERLAFGPDAAAASISEAEEQLRGLAVQRFAKAA